MMNDNQNETEETVATYSEEFDKAIEEIMGRMGVEIKDTRYGEVIFGANDEEPLMNPEGGVYLAGGDFYIDAYFKYSGDESDHEKAMDAIKSMITFADSIRDLAMVLLARQTEIKTASDTWDEANRISRFYTGL